MDFFVLHYISFFFNIIILIYFILFSTILQLVNDLQFILRLIVHFTPP